MSAIVSLPGAAALSPFRLDKIRREAAQQGLSLGTLTARHWHFMEVDETLDAAQMRLVEQALDYGTPTAAPTARGVKMSSRSPTRAVARLASIVSVTDGGGPLNISRTVRPDRLAWMKKTATTTTTVTATSTKMRVISERLSVTRRF